MIIRESFMILITSGSKRSRAVRWPSMFRRKISSSTSPFPHSSEAVKWWKKATGTLSTGLLDRKFMNRSRFVMEITPSRILGRTYNSSITYKKFLSIQTMEAGKRDVH